MSSSLVQEGSVFKNGRGSWTQYKAFRQGVLGERMRREWKANGSAEPPVLTGTEIKRMATKIVQDHPLMKVLVSREKPYGRSPAFIINFSRFYSMDREGYGWVTRDCAKVRLSNGEPATKQELIENGWQWGKEECVLCTCLHPENAISMEKELHRIVFGLSLDWEQCLNTQVGGGGLRAKDFPIDGTPFVVAVCYRLDGIGSFVLKDKRMQTEGNRSNTLAFLLNQDRDTVLRGIGRLSTVELDDVAQLFQVVKSSRGNGIGNSFGNSRLTAFESTLPVDAADVHAAAPALHK